MKHAVLSATFTCVIAMQPIAVLAQDSGQPITATELETDGYSFPTDLTPGADPTQLANYGWRLFIAATQQTDATLDNPAGRTASRRDANFLTSGSAPRFDNPLVFEGFYHRAESYPFYSSEAPTSPIDQRPVYHYQDDLTISDGQFVNLDETNQIGQNYLYFRQSGEPDFPVLFMAKVNDAEVNYARGRAAPSPKASWDFPSIIEVKSAWRPVKSITNSDPNSYHQAQASYYTSDASGKIIVNTDTFALIGLHIIQKTENYPGFIFTTFEHVDAVTRDTAGNITDPAYHLTSPNLAYGTGEPTNPQATPTGAYAVNAPGLSGSADQPTTYDLPAAGPQPAGQPGGYQTVVQPQTITSEVNDVNNAVRDLLLQLSPSSVWANYRLKGVQAIPTSDQAELNYYLANIVVESSQPGIQLFRGGVKGTGTETFTNVRDQMNVSVGVTEGQPVPAPEYTMGGCMGCHGIAQQLGQDFSFLAGSAAGQGFTPDPVVRSLPIADLVRAQDEIARRRGIEFFGE